MSVSTGIRVSLIVVILLIELYLTLKAPSNRGAGATGAAAPPCPLLTGAALPFSQSN
jgi:hypothetical protein